MAASGHLASRAGFYPTGDRRGRRIHLKCRDGCGGETWIDEDEPDTEALWRTHARDFPGCSLVREIKGCDYIISIRNDPDVINYKTLQHSGDVTPLLIHQRPELQHLGQAKNPNYSLYVKRKQTFEQFPRNISPDLDVVLCEGGFLYIDIDDTVECLWCGVQLTNFRELMQSAHSFDLWRIHARKNICCALVALMKQPRYVHRVFDDMSEEEKVEARRKVDDGTYNFSPGMRDEIFGPPADLGQAADINNTAQTQHSIRNHDATPFLDAKMPGRRRNEQIEGNIDVSCQDNDEYPPSSVQPEESHDNEHNRGLLASCPSCNCAEINRLVVTSTHCCTACASCVDESIVGEQCPCCGVPGLVEGIIPLQLER